jgi:hypothetical protein
MGFNPSNAPYALSIIFTSLFLADRCGDAIMPGRALDYRNTIDCFVSRNKDLHALELSNTDWESLKLVTSWLKSFRSATTQMSATKVPMVSTTHAIFRGLQEDIKNILRNLSNSVSPSIKLGLTDAHRKLSDYYYQFDASPFYTWAARMWILISNRLF